MGQPPVVPVEVQQQQLLQAQMLQMQQMQKQQKELQRLQQVQQPPPQVQKPRAQPKQSPAPKRPQALVENKARVTNKNGAQALTAAELEGGLAPGITRPK